MQKNAVEFLFLLAVRFQMPADPSTPIIMIGSGTGLASFSVFFLGLLSESWRHAFVIFLEIT